MSVKSAEHARTQLTWMLRGNAKKKVDSLIDAGVILYNEGEYNELLLYHDGECPELQDDSEECTCDPDVTMNGMLVNLPKVQ